MDELRAFFENLASEWDNQQPANRSRVLTQLLTPYRKVIEHANTILEVGTKTGALIPLLKE